MEKQNKFLGIICIIILGLILIVVIFMDVQDKKQWRQKQVQNKSLIQQIIQLKTDIDVLKGQMEIYKNIPIDLRSRIELLEGRYDRISSFQNQLCQDKMKGVVK